MKEKKTRFEQVPVKLAEVALRLQTREPATIPKSRQARREAFSKRARARICSPRRIVLLISRRIN
jgi:hypothetical protein